MRIALNKYCATIGGAALIISLFTGCSDDSFNNSSSGDKFIAFDVKGVSSLQKTTRARNSQFSPVISLQGSSAPLYLVPVESEGFPGDRNATRASVTDASTISSFAIYASRSDASAQDVPDYMYDVEITKDAGWTPAQEYLWLGDSPLHFIGYSPYVATPGDEGIVTLPSSSLPRSIKFVTPAEVTDQFDLLYCQPVDASASPCSLTFNHALGAIRFVAGSELKPCTIKSITISGILSEGTLDLESGEWSDMSGNASYSLTLNKSLMAAEGSDYVEAGSEITSESELFMLLPQEVDANAKIQIIADFDGSETTLTAPLAGQIWKEGDTVTYRISANPNSDSLILDVSGDFNTPYTGSEVTFNVNSSLGNGDDAAPVEWIAEFVDDEGNVIDRPQWVKEITDSGNGNVAGSLTTIMRDIKFLSISEGSQMLQDTSDINTASGNNPYNLSSSTGAASVENTANTYLINAPGVYSLPLVYGNAIKNGAVNSGAYTATTSNRYALKKFVNNFGNAITDPYIYNNSGCTPASASLVWEDQLNLVQNVRLSNDGKSILFDIPKQTIRQGNAMVAVKDDADNILWSWQLWITDYNLSQAAATQTILGKDLMSRNIGYVTAGDKVEFEAATVKIRFSQTNVPDGLEPLSKTVELKQAGAIKTTPEYNTFYEWGRKDPMWDSDWVAYTASHSELTSLATSTPSSLSDISMLPQWSIANPDVKMCTKQNIKLPYNNLWNVNNETADNVKSIYDPSPAGYKVALNAPLQEFSKVCSVTVSGNDFVITSSSDPTTLTLPALGYIEPGDGNHTGQGQRAELWFATIMATRINVGSLVATPTACQSQTNSPFSGFSIRPVAE